MLADGYEVRKTALLDIEHAALHRRRRMRRARREPQPGAASEPPALVDERAFEHEQLGAARVDNTSEPGARRPALEPHRVAESLLRVERPRLDTGTRRRP